MMPVATAGPTSPDPKASLVTRGTFSEVLAGCFMLSPESGVGRVVLYRKQAPSAKRRDHC